MRPWSKSATGFLEIIQRKDRAVGLVRVVSDKTTSRTSEPSNSGKQEGSLERGVSSAEKIRQALGNLAAKL
jgi:hypothetical protein